MSNSKSNKPEDLFSFISDSIDWESGINMLHKACEYYKQAKGNDKEYEKDLVLSTAMVLLNKERERTNDNDDGHDATPGKSSEINNIN